ncbi:hypothetical protein [Phnomibacter ginsenosidimutans]|uniref:Peptidase A2 domain-containing protein n=1 Tax=Phnomibacter ginsenosidimutans TaxID=2676868 RepID=A0A6I6GDL5_9BACT|nr:hypothetical protein [Phnomibacter ginsenosidimutans]QGW28420.1 hypothetical protein GLV81_10210 [Phnomibacter ginsenosidimutans]
MKKTLTNTFLLLLISTWSIGQHLDVEKVKWYDFYWSGDSSNPKEAMMLRSAIDTIDFNFRWQFDTGSPRTFFYGDTWLSFCAAFPMLRQSFFTIDTFKADGFINVKNGGVQISGNQLPKNIIGLLPNYGNHIDKQIILDNLGSSTTVGTMGIDLFRQGVLIIDFKKNKIGYADRLSKPFYATKSQTIDFTLFQNRIILPVTIGGKQYDFFYDSGASLFPLKTTTAFTAFQDAVQYTDTLYNITTWGKSHDVPGGVLKKRFRLAT